jgi:hypothetical protein
MEIESIIGNDERAIFVEKYFVLDRHATSSLDGGSSRDPQKQILEWKTDRRSFPMLTLKAGSYAYSEDNLMKTFKEGD